MLLKPSDIDNLRRLSSTLEMACRNGDRNAENSGDSTIVFQPTIHQSIRWSAGQLWLWSAPPAGAGAVVSWCCAGHLTGGCAGAVASSFQLACFRPGFQVLSWSCGAGAGAVHSW